MDGLRYGVVVLILIASASALPQRIETYFKTYFVAVTEIEFKTTPYVCISLINATRPCLDPAASKKSPRFDPDAEAPIIAPTAVQRYYFWNLLFRVNK